MFSLAHLADLAIVLVTAALFAQAFSQIYRPWRPATAGEATPRMRIRLPLLARLRLHGVWLLGVAVILLGASALGILVTPLPFVVAALIALLLLVMPVSYTVSDFGIAVGQTPLRRWTEFGGLTARNGWIYLQPVTGARGLLIRTPDSAAMPALATELRGLLRASYKGQIGPYRGTVEWIEPALEENPLGVGAPA